MCTILLSIHPEFVNKIISGQKRYEFRKVKAKREPDKIIIYSTSPICKVIGEAEIEQIIVNSPEVVWDVTKSYSGINKAFYIDYYANRDIAIAYKLKNVIEYDQPKELEEFGIKAAPQSFIYV